VTRCIASLSSLSSSLSISFSEASTSINVTVGSIFRCRAAAAEMGVLPKPQPWTPVPAVVVVSCDSGRLSLPLLIVKRLPARSVGYYCSCHPPAIHLFFFRETQKSRWPISTRTTRAPPVSGLFDEVDMTSLYSTSVEVERAFSSVSYGCFYHMIALRIPWTPIGSTLSTLLKSLRVGEAEEIMDYSDMPELQGTANDVD
jgi:hypothetical protein